MLATSAGTPPWLSPIRADCGGPASRTISLRISPATRGSCSPAANSARAAFLRGAAGVGLGAGADDPCRPQFRIAADRIQRQGTRAVRPLGLVRAWKLRPLVSALQSGSFRPSTIPEHCHSFPKFRETARGLFRPVPAISAIKFARAARASRQGAGARAHNGLDHDARVSCGLGDDVGQFEERYFAACAHVRSGPRCQPMAPHVICVLPSKVAFAQGITLTDPYIVLLIGFGVLVLLTAWLPMVLSEAPLSLPIFCVAIGAGISASPFSIEVSHPAANLLIVERLTELVLIISLTGAALKIDRKIGWRSWMITWRLLAVAMPLTIAALAVIGYIMLVPPFLRG